jgi:hypothetical protein
MRYVHIHSEMGFCFVAEQERYLLSNNLFVRALGSVKSHLLGTGGSVPGLKCLFTSTLAKVDIHELFPTVTPFLFVTAFCSLYTRLDSSDPDYEDSSLTKAARPQMTEYTSDVMMSIEIHYRHRKLNRN